MRAAIYIRISRARRVLLDAQRQEPPCRAFCASQSWTVVEVYVDDNRSAWKREVRRDAFERMLADIRAGRIDAIVTWQADRLLRTVEDASAIVTVAKAYGTVIANVGGTIDLSTEQAGQPADQPWAGSASRQWRHPGLRQQRRTDKGSNPTAHPWTAQR